MALAVEGRREWAVILIAAALGIVSALVMGQAIMVRIADNRLSNYGYTLLTHAAEVAQTSRAVMQEINTVKDDAPPCSEADLYRMRRLSFRAEFLYDVGRIENGALACTALWGKFASTLKLPLPHRVQGNGDMLWEHVDTIGPLRMHVDVAAQGNAIVFTSPFAFKPYEARTDAFSGVVVTHDGKYVYRIFGDDAGLQGAPAAHPSSTWRDLRTHRVWSECVSEVDVCVVGSLAHIGIFHVPVWLWLGVALLGGISGVGLGLAACFYGRVDATLAQRIRHAIAVGGLTVVYQPLVRIRDRRIMGVEALARLTGAKGENIPPDMFIRVAEEHGMIREITRRVIGIALRDMRPRLRARPDFYCSINLSASDILDPELCDWLNQEVASHGINPRQIMLELTERSTAAHEELIACMLAFRGHGYKFYIDDFGTGYSSLAYLAKLPIGGIKIDRMFTDAIRKEAVSSLIVQNICAVANVLSVRVVVEGVETPGQAAYIQHIAPEAIGQGWLFSKPVSAAAIYALPPEYLAPGQWSVGDMRYDVEGPALS